MGKKLFGNVRTQLVGTRQVDYSVEVGLRYLFRLSKGKPVEMK